MKRLNLTELICASLLLILVLAYHGLPLSRFRCLFLTSVVTRLESTSLSPDSTRTLSLSLRNTGKERVFINGPTNYFPGQVIVVNEKGERFVLMEKRLNYALMHISFFPPGRVLKKNDEITWALDLDKDFVDALSLYSTTGWKEGVKGANKIAIHCVLESACKEIKSPTIKVSHW
jgi:hypothetical protein